MRNTCKLSVFPEVVAKTPRHLGVNVEVQEYHDAINLWDWLADSGVTVVREFHPEVNLRKCPVKENEWDPINDRIGFDSFRQRILASPENGPVRWDNYRFAETIQWMGVPDEIARKLQELGIEPLYSLGYMPKMFPRPILKDLEFQGIPEDAHIDWGAAASAYEYYFAVVHHYAFAFAGKRFMMLNEPENQFRGFYLPPDLAAKEGSWGQLIFKDGTRDEATRYLGIVSSQYAAIARFARMAVDDVETLLKAAGRTAGLRLSGPTNVAWEIFWDKTGKYFDTLDYHFYNPHPDTFGLAFPAVAAKAGKMGKSVATSEFHRFSGQTDFADNPFVFGSSLKLAGMLMDLLQLSSKDDPEIDFATLYLLHFPSTHRNYKHLLYGDMNMLDWTGEDRAPWGRSEEWHPTAAEMQIRFATPAYFMFRMLARCAADGKSPVPHPILRWGMSNPLSIFPQDLCSDLKIVVVDQGKQILVNILNNADTALENLEICLDGIPTEFAHAVVRECSRKNHDKAVAEMPVVGNRIRMDVPPCSLTQVIFTKLRLDRISSLRIEERTFTPGSVKGLELHQTTMLRAIGIIDGHEHDLTNLDIVWSSSAPAIVRADQCGLIQRMRNSGGKTIIKAKTAGGLESPAIEIPGNISRK
ncbi:MAG: hypothetical protein WAX69_13500 [Victivallales bacterium]